MTKWRCPHCSMIMERTHEYDFLGEAGGIIGFGSGTVNCIHCRREVSVLDITSGKYDFTPLWLKIVGAVAGLLFMLVALYVVLVVIWFAVKIAFGVALF